VADHFDGELGPPRALLAPCLLLLLAESPGHGYELMDRLKPLGFDWNGPGPIYRELRALEAANLVTSAWSAPKAGPVPRIYELTDAGHEALERSAAGITELQGLIAHYLDRFGKVTGARRPSRSSTQRSSAVPRAPRRAKPAPRGR
jgi:PadR family transcriptional regulator, regulatory protein PadR